MCDICTPHLNLDFKITILAVMMFYLKSKNGLKWVPILNLDDFFVFQLFRSFPKKIF